MQFVVLMTRVSLAGIVKFSPLDVVQSTVAEVAARAGPAMNNPVPRMAAETVSAVVRSMVRFPFEIWKQETAALSRAAVSVIDPLADHFLPLEAAEIVTKDLSCRW